MIVACWHASIHEAFRQGMSQIFSFAFEAAAAAVALVPRKSVLPATAIVWSFDKENDRVYCELAFMQGMRNWEQLFKIYCNSIAFMPFCIIQ